MLILMVAKATVASVATAEQASEWGAVSFNALCLAGMPSAECADVVVNDHDMGKKERMIPKFSTNNLHDEHPMGPDSMHPSGPSAQAPAPSSPLSSSMSAKSPKQAALYSIAVPGHRQVSTFLRLPSAVRVAHCPMKHSVDFVPTAYLYRMHVLGY